jgi:hypothetical protein
MTVDSEPRTAEGLQPMTADAVLKASLDEIRRALKLLCKPGEVYELRALGTAKATISGYYDNADALVRDAAGVSNAPNLEASGVYVTLNPIRADLLARASNRLESYAKHTTGDADIVARYWFPFDCDPVRPPGISSTDGEHAATLARARQIRDFLEAGGWPAPIFADSGNGAHLLYRIDQPNDDATRDLLKRGLEALASWLDDDAVRVDRTTLNAARIWKVYGTVARKGDNMPDRPHRLARILEARETPAVVSREQLEELAARAPKPQRPHFAANKKTGTGSFNLDDFIARYNIPVKRIDAYQGGRRLILDACVFDANHSGTSAAIIEGPDGALGYSCLHNGCADWHWADVRELFEPGYQMRNSAPDADAGATGQPNGSVFKTALTAPRFLAQADETSGASLAGGLLVRSGASLLASPRGLGKTILAMKLAIAAADGVEFCGEVLPASRVLYCAYENSPAVLRDRLRRLGGAESENMRILTRSKAPKLQSDDWRAFPVEDYDFIIIDSLSPALEGGIDERQGGQNSDALAALLDIIQRGPGALIIANTTKTAASIRGSGILSDRADMIFEVRDATGFKPNPRQEVWWEGLVENQGESAWAGRARRRRGKTVFRLALVASKTRVGPEVDPRVLELALPNDEPWTVDDVTADVVGAHDRAKTEAVEKRQAKEDAAAAAVKKALPMTKAQAVEILAQNHIPRKSARRGRAPTGFLPAPVRRRTRIYLERSTARIHKRGNPAQRMTSRSRLLPPLSHRHGKN